ncbi:MAG: hypothetical protein AAF661_05860 [Pseudomonadota bacterium]
MSDVSKGGSVSIVNGEAHHEQHFSARQTPEDMLSHTEARSQWGSPKALSAAAPTDVIVIDGIETSLSAAEKLGAVEAIPGGGYRRTEAATQGNPKTTQGGTEGDTEAASFAFDDATEAQISDVISKTGGDAQISTINSIAEHGFEAADFGGLASQLGVEPHEAQQQMASIFTAFENQAANVCAKYGVGDLADFRQWADAVGKGREIQAAMLAHAQQGDPGVYADLATQYAESYDTRDPNHVMEMLAEIGVKSRFTDGQVILDVPGAGEMSWQAAHRAGIVSLSKR